MNPDTIIYTFFTNKQVIVYKKIIEEIQKEIHLELDKNPKDIKCLTILSQITYKYQYDYKKGLLIIQNILSLDPQNIDARIDLILIMMEFRVGKQDNCISLIQECFQLDSNYWRVYYVAGIFYNYISDEKQSRNILSEGFHLFPDNVWISCYITQIYSDKPSLDKLSQQMFEQILKAEIKDCDVLRYISYIYGSFKKQEESLQYLEQSLALNPNSPSTLNNYAQLLRMSKLDNQKCVEYCQKAIQINPKVINAYYNLGIAYQNLSEQEKCLFYYKKSIETRKLKTPYQKIYLILKQQQKNTEAQYFIQKSIKIYPNDLVLNYYNLYQLSRYQDNPQLIDLEAYQEFSIYCLNEGKYEFKENVYTMIINLSNLQFLYG